MLRHLDTMSRAFCRTSSNSKNVKGMPKSLGSVKRSKQHVNNTQDTKNVKTLKMLWPSKKLLIHQLSLGMTLGNNNEI